MARYRVGANLTDDQLLRRRIERALEAAPDLSLKDAAEGLLEVLGYRSERRPLERSGRVDEFIDLFPAPNPDTRTENEFCENATAVHVLFQFTSDEIPADVGQGALFEVGGFDTDNTRSFMFAAVDLREPSYSRGPYARFTREVNKRLRSPTVVLFRTAGGRLTFAFVHRRPHKLDPERDVLGSVSLIREIDPGDLHRAHTGILADLALENRLAWMTSYGKPRDFEGLLAAWLAALDTQELNKTFYRELFEWFNQAVESATFPQSQPLILHAEEHVIRLITRLLFIWFIKQKNLIAGDLFIEAQVGPLLKDYDRASGDSYYRAVLQNLFFATLNTEIKRRGFSKGGPQVRRSQGGQTHRNTSLYRYKDEMSDPDALLRLFDQTPFINGGLFECLDSEDATGDGGWRIDCFSDNPTHRALLSIPNRLFFGEQGLIDLLHSYKFTVEENTPAEQDVALDPELLGQVFENLLAAYNPETRKTVRRLTGSYYTPRSIVDYMVEEALIKSLAEKTPPADGDREFWHERLRYLLDYQDAFNDASDLFEEAETAGLVHSIAETRILDPAVGSGAFPMGILQRLTLALRRLDPTNERWETFQKQRAIQRAATAFDTEDQEERDAELQEISDTFQHYHDSDFGRKLYLIQNSIYGIDIQPVACEIAKLRFFISLAIEQEPTSSRDHNYGIKPLPNLETRFIAANTLVGLQGQRVLSSDRARDLEKRLSANRERYFHATTRRTKQNCRRVDRRLRVDLADELHRLGMPADAARRVAQWTPMTRTEAADWFDAEHMFGITDGFDIVIGNPPYRQVLKGTHSKLRFPYSEGMDKGKQNLYKLFVEQSFNSCKSGGVCTLIVQSSLMCDLSSAATRQMLLEHTQMRHIVEFPQSAKSKDAQVFKSVAQGTCVYQFTKIPTDNSPIAISIGNDISTISAPTFATIRPRDIQALYPELRCFPHITPGSVSILEKLAANREVRPLKDYVQKISQGDLNLSTHSRRFSTAKSSVVLIRGRHVSRYQVKWGEMGEYCEEGFLPDRVTMNADNTFLISQEVMSAMADRRLNFAMISRSHESFLCGHSVNKTLLVNQSLSGAFLALLNSRFMDWFFRITSTNNHVQGYELEQLPIPSLTSATRRRFEGLAERIVRAKSIDDSQDTSTLESEIDVIVYELFDLSDAEIEVVERSQE